MNLTDRLDFNLLDLIAVELLNWRIAENVLQIGQVISMYAAN